jgi:alkylhydroperoxidase family enzyme
MRSALQSDQLVVEFVGVVATYNMVSRFLVALGVESE